MEKHDLVTHIDRSARSFLRLEDGTRVVTKEGVLAVKGRPELLNVGREMKVRIRLVDSFGHSKFFFHTEVTI